MVLLAIGTGSAVLLAFIVNALFRRGDWSSFAYGMLGVLAIICGFAFSAGYRLAFLKPSAQGSTLGAFGWSGISIFWGLLAGIIFFIEKGPENLHLVVAALAASVWSFLRARKIAKAHTY